MENKKSNWEYRPYPADDSKGIPKENMKGTSKGILEGYSW